MKSKAGFTLVEMLVALVILTLMSAAALAGLQHMIRAKELQSLHQERYQVFMRAYAILSQDLYYGIWLKGGEDKIGVSIAPDAIGFSRTLMQGPTKAIPVGIQYTWDNLELKRKWQGHESLLLTGLDDIRVWVLTKERIWVEHHNMGSSAGVPLAIKFIFTDKVIGELTWSYTLAST